MDKFLVFVIVNINFLLLIFAFVSFLFYSRFVNREIADLEQKNKDLKEELRLKQIEVNTILSKYFEFCEKHEKALDEIEAIVKELNQSLDESDSEIALQKVRIEELESALEVYTNAESEESEDDSDTSVTVDDILTKGKNDIDFGGF
jgi:septal ring factor EnvC (AmiA/AmiB activator)